jgi:hypothetical protein
MVTNIIGKSLAPYTLPVEQISQRNKGLYYKTWSIRYSGKFNKISSVRWENSPRRMCHCLEKWQFVKGVGEKGREVFGYHRQGKRRCEVRMKKVQEFISGSGSNKRGREWLPRADSNHRQAD